MSEEDVDYAKRAIERRQARNAERKSTIPEVERLRRQVVILADRLALALHVMSHHQEVVEYKTTLEWMKHHEDWVEKLLTEEPKVPEHRSRKFDFYRKAQRYTYLCSGIRTMLRVQVENPPSIPKLGERR